MSKICFLGVFLSILGCLTTTVIYPHLQWDPRNPIFKGSHSLNVEPMSRIDIVCPSPALIPAKIQNTIPKEQLYENLWIVDKPSYDACVVDTSKFTNRLVKKCNDPLNINYYTMVFQQFSATANGLEFTPGKEYYFISTSDGTKITLERTSGGHCASHSMKMAVYVCLDSNDPKCKQDTPSIPAPVVCPTEAVPTTAAPTTAAPTQPSPCTDSSVVVSIYNHTKLLPAMANQTALIPDLLSVLQNLETKLNEMENKLDNCTATASKCSAAPTPAPTSAPTTAPTPAPTTAPIRESCKAYYAAGKTTSGVFTINPTDGLGIFDVYCDQTTDGGGWAVFQKRFNGKVDFSTKGWTSYVNGFGNLTQEFWLGLDKIHRLTATPVILRVDLGTPDGEKRFAQYTGFSVGDAASNYTLTSGSYSSGTAGDSLGFSNGAKFSSFDQDNDKWSDNSCAIFFKGAWWHNQCHKSSLNGIYRNGSHPSNFADGLIWETWKGYTYSFSQTEMKVKP